MSEDSSIDRPDFVTSFTAYQPKLRPMGGNQGGGYKIELSISESEWNKVKDINDPKLQAMHFQVALVGVNVK